MKKNTIIILVFILLFAFTINYSYIDSYLKSVFVQEESAFVEKVIDGDTIKINGTSVRLLGINCPEKGEEYYLEAKQYLESLILNKTVVLKYGNEKYDKYNRVLAYVFLENENINLKIIKEGYANYYFPSGKDKYYDDFVSVWQECLEINENLCEKSENICVDCVDLFYNNEEASLINSCSFECNFSEWKIKGEGRKIYYFDDSKADVGKQDTLFLRDNENRLVLWKILE